MIPLTPTEIAGYFANGFIIIRDALPLSLISDLRRECEKATAFVHKSRAQAQRFQPISKYAEQVDLKPFRAYAELSELQLAFQQVLGPEVFYGSLDIYGVFIEPLNEPWSFTWHRDITQTSSRMATEEEFAAFALDWDALNQINCALYDDSCTWYVPGSHLRVIDSPAELAAGRGPDGHELDGSKPDEGTEMRLREIGDMVGLERLHLNRTRSMPGAVQVHLNAGDLLLYRAYGWHCGNYVPYRKRATILDVLYTPAHHAWRQAWLEGKDIKWKSKTLSK